MSLLDIIDGLDEEICSSSPRFARVKDLLAYLNWASGVFKVNGNETNIILFPWSFFKLPDQGSDWRKELRTRPDEYLAHLEERIDYFAFSNMMSAFDQGKNNFIKFLRNIGIKNLKKYYESLRHQEEEMSHTTAHIPRVLAPPPNAQSPVLRSQGHEEISIQISDESDDDEVVKISEEFTPPIASEDSMESPDKPRCTTSILSKLLDEKLRYSFSTYLEQQIGLVTVSDLFSEAAAVRIPQDTQIAETFVAEESFTCVLRSIALALEERASGQVEELMVATRLGVSRRVGMLVQVYLEILLHNFLAIVGNSRI
ncbi:hypothetical protein EON65_34935 [archaeon]|nr:MAG: hypothetical protein EON65_34935 [archaeon]